MTAADTPSSPSGLEIASLDLMTVQHIEGLRRAFERLNGEADGRLGSKSMVEMAVARAEYQAALQKHGLELISTALSAIRDRAQSQGGEERPESRARILTQPSGEEREGLAKLINPAAFDGSTSPWPNHGVPEDGLPYRKDRIELANHEHVQRRERMKDQALFTADAIIAAGWRLSPPVPADLEAVGRKVYLAARYSRHPEMRGVRADLEAKGYTVTSRWIDGGHELTKEGSTEAHEAERIRYAQEDMADLLFADICISFTEEPRTTTARGGRHVEYGVALAKGMRCIVVGWRENVFHCLPEVEFYPSWSDEVLPALSPAPVGALVVEAREALRDLVYAVADHVNPLFKAINGEAGYLSLLTPHVGRLRAALRRGQTALAAAPPSPSADALAKAQPMKAKP